MDAQAKVDYRRRCIDRIKDLDDELIKLGVKRERADFSTFTIDEIVEYGKNKARQLERRKEWLGEQKVKEMLNK